MGAQTTRPPAPPTPPRATTPTQTLAKPGMGVDEGYMIMFNEMSRILALKDVL